MKEEKKQNNEVKCEVGSGKCDFFYPSMMPKEYAQLVIEKVIIDCLKEYPLLMSQITIKKSSIDGCYDNKVLLRQSNLPTKKLHSESFKTAPLSKQMHSELENVQTIVGRIRNEFQQHRMSNQHLLKIILDKKNQLDIASKQTAEQVSFLGGLHAKELMFQKKLEEISIQQNHLEADIDEGMSSKMSAIIDSYESAIGMVLTMSDNNRIFREILDVIQTENRSTYEEVINYKCVIDEKLQRVKFLEESKGEWDREANVELRENVILLTSQQDEMNKIKKDTEEEYNRMQHELELLEKDEDAIRKNRMGLEAMMEHVIGGKEMLQKQLLSRKAYYEQQEDKIRNDLLGKHEEIETINNSLTESEKDIEQYLRDTESLENAVSALMLQSSNLDIDLDARTKSYDEAIIIRDDKNAEYSRLTESLANLKSESEEVAANFQTNMILGKSLTHKLFDLKTTEFTLEQNLQDTERKLLRLHHDQEDLASGLESDIIALEEQLKISFDKLHMKTSKNTVIHNMFSESLVELDNLRVANVDANERNNSLRQEKLSLQDSLCALQDLKVSIADHIDEKDSMTSISSDLQKKLRSLNDEILNLDATENNLSQYVPSAELLDAIEREADEVYGTWKIQATSEHQRSVDAISKQINELECGVDAVFPEVMLQRRKELTDLTNEISEIAKKKHQAELRASFELSHAVPQTNESKLPALKSLSISTPLEKLRNVPFSESLSLSQSSMRKPPTPPEVKSKKRDHIAAPKDDVAKGKLSSKRTFSKKANDESDRRKISHEVKVVSPKAKVESVKLSQSGQKENKQLDRDQPNKHRENVQRISPKGEEMTNVKRYNSFSKLNAKETKNTDWFFDDDGNF